MKKIQTEALPTFRGPVPKGRALQLDHLCKNKRCFNPKHLEIVSARTNTLRADDAPASVNLKKEICIRGHVLTGENIQLKKGHRICKACRRIYNKQQYDKNK